ERALARGNGPVLLAGDLPPAIAALGSGERKAVPTEQTVASSAAPEATDDADGIDLTRVSNDNDESPGSEAPLVPPQADPAASGVDGLLAGQSTLDDIERQAIMATLQSTGGDRTHCARILGIDKSTL